jgi:hypothetical protein
MGCPNRRAGTCPVVARVPYAAAERAVMGVIESVLLNYPEFMASCVSHMRVAIERMAQAVPKELDAERTRHAQVDSQIVNLVKVLASGSDSDAIRGQLQVLETEKAALLDRIKQLMDAGEAQVSMPDEAWVREQMKDLVGLLSESAPQAVRLVRSMIGKVIAEEVPIPRKTRGYVRIRFSVDGWSALISMLAGKLPASVIALLGAARPSGPGGDEFHIALGGPTAMDAWGMKIVQWRSEGVPWREIARRTGLKVANAHVVWKRWKDHRDAA